MRVGLRRFAALSTLVFLLACAPAQPGASVATGAAPPGATPPPPTPKRGGVVVYAGPAGPNTLNPYVTAGAPDRRGLGPVYESLVSFKYAPDFDYRADFEVVPWLAERWEQPNDKTYIFYLRKGVRWQDGEEFTAKDVVFSYDYGQDPKNAFRIMLFIRDIESAEALDRYTVKVTLKEPSPDFLIRQADLNMMILPEHVYARGDDFKKVAIGTGPFRVKEFSPEKGVLFERNNNYWQEGKPYPDGVQLLVGLDVSGMVAAFLAKKTDMLNVNDRPQVDAVRASLPDAKYAAIKGDVGTHLVMKLDRPPFNDIRVRRAIHLTVDRQALINLATFGDGVINPPGMIGTKKGWAIPEEELLKLPGYRQPKDADVAEAKRLLAEAGYPDGFKSKLLVSNQRPSAFRISEPLASQAKKIGIDFTIEATTTPDQLQRELKGDFDTTLTSTADMQLKYQWDYFHSTGANNKFGLSDPKLDELLVGMYNAPDVSRRKQAAREFQNMMQEKVYAIPTIELSSYALWQPWLRDYVYSLSNSSFVDIQTASRFWLDTSQMPSR